MESSAKAKINVSEVCTYKLKHLFCVCNVMGYNYCYVTNSGVISIYMGKLLLSSFTFSSLPKSVRTCNTALDILS